MTICPRSYQQNKVNLFWPIFVTGCPGAGPTTFPILFSSATADTPRLLAIHYHQYVHLLVGPNPLPPLSPKSFQHTLWNYDYIHLLLQPLLQRFSLPAHLQRPGCSQVILSLLQSSQEAFSFFYCLYFKSRKYGILSPAAASKLCLLLPPSNT